MKKLTALLVATTLFAPTALGAMQAAPAAALVPAAGDKARGQYAPAAAFGKDAYLVVWRKGLANREAKLFASRVDKSGRALDAKGIALAGDMAFQHEAAVAFGGDVFLVVFSAIKEGTGADGLLQSGVFGVRVSADGKVLDAKPVPIGAAPGHQAQPAVAFDGANFRVAWVALLDTDTKVNSFRGVQVKGLMEIRTARVSPAGKVLDAGAGVLAARGPGAQQWSAFGAAYQPTVACSGGKVMIGFSYGSSYPQAVLFGANQPGPASATDKAARIELCQVRKGVGRPVGKIRYPALAANGKIFMASWTDGRGRGFWGPPWPGMLFDIAGKPLSPDGVLPAAGKDKPCMNPALTFDGEAFTWVWVDHKTQKLLANRISPAGKTLEAQDLVLEQTKKNRAGRYLPRDFDAPALASDGAGSTLLVYHKYATAATGRVQVVGRILRK